MSLSKITCKHFFQLAALIVGLGQTAVGQTIPSTPSSRSTFDGLTPKGLEPGSPVGSYQLSGFDTINLYSGRLNFVLPLLAVGGRGEAGYTISLPLGNTWSVRTDDDPNSPGNTLYGFDDAFYANVKYQYRPLTLIPRRSGQTVQVGFCSGNPSLTADRFYLTLTRLTLRWADGSEVELHDTMYDGAVRREDNLNCSDFNGVNRGRTWVAGDGSGVTFIANSDIKDSTTVPAGQGLLPDGVLYTRNGVQYHIAQGVVTMIRDRNGNKIQFSSVSGENPLGENFTITDSLGRTIQVNRNIPWSVSEAIDTAGVYDEIIFPGNGGTDRKSVV